MRTHTRDGTIAIWHLKTKGVCQHESSHNDRVHTRERDGTQETAQERWCTRLLTVFTVGQCLSENGEYKDQHMELHLQK